MKKCWIALTLTAALLLAGCHAAEEGSPTSQGQEEAAKACKMEVLSAQDGSLLATVTDQEAIGALAELEEWKEAEKPPEGLSAQYRLFFYQEKTLLLGQDPDAEREYEPILRLTTYQDSPYVELVLSGELIKNIRLPESSLTFCYEASDGFREQLEKLLQ